MCFLFLRHKMNKSLIVVVALAVLMVAFQETECFTGGGIITKKSLVTFQIFSTFNSYHLTDTG